MNTPKSNHFVPCSYLARFTDSDGFLHVFDRHLGSFRRQRPKEVMTINYYYRQEWAPTGVDPNIMEKGLGEWLETHAKKSIDRLINEPATLTEQEIATLLTYLELQRIRVPRQFSMVKSLMRETLMTNMPPEAAALIRTGRASLTIEKPARFEYIRTLIGKLYPWFGAMKWEICQAEEGANFVTTDSPLSYYNPEALPPAEPGIALAGTKVFFPLDSRHVLLLRHSEYRTKSKMSPVTVLPEPSVKDGRISITHGEVWNPDKVNTFNWQMLQLCDRFVVAASKEVLEACISYDSRWLYSA